MKPAKAVSVALGSLLVIGGLAFWLLVLRGLDHVLLDPIPRVDVSSDPRYAGTLGLRLRTKRELLALGVTMDRDYARRIDVIKLVEPPGFSGPEVVARSTLPTGAVLEVVAVQKTDSRLVNQLEYVVRRLDAPAPLEGQMAISVDTTSNRNFGVSEANFALLPAR